MKFEIYKTRDTGSFKSDVNPSVYAYKEKYPTESWPDLERWFIDINSIEELEALRKEVDCELVITDSIWCDPLPAIEVYDDYRE